MGRTRGHPTDKECRDFIVAYIENDELLTRTSEAMGIAHQTLSDWKARIFSEDGDLYDEYSAIVGKCRQKKQQADEEARQQWLQETAEKRKELQNLYLELQLIKARDLKNNPDMLANVPFNQMSTAYGTVVDKDRLINGDSTANTKSEIKVELPAELKGMFGDD